MKIEYNSVFESLLKEYDLPFDLSLDIEIPAYSKTILNSEILVTENSITLKALNHLRKATHTGENQSTIEDDENHFHVECLNNKMGFMTSIKTLVLLADKFEKANIEGIRFHFSYQTPELGFLWAKENNLHEDGDEYYISDRLSFYTRRQGEDITLPIEERSDFDAVLVIDI